MIILILSMTVVVCAIVAVSHLVCIHKLSAEMQEKGSK